MHHFWECPVALAVVEQIAARVGTPITRANVWLAEPPAGMLQPVWDVVALAAMSAMESTRQGLRAATQVGAAVAADGGPPQAEGQGPSPIEVAKSRAVADFWQRVVAFAAMGVPRKGWEGVGANHPILAIVEGELRCTGAVLDGPGE
jgi:hypothetical protein